MKNFRHKTSPWLSMLLTLLISQHAFAFDAGEHAIIGDVAYTDFEKVFPNKIRNLEANISFSYGQLIAMSADMYVSVEEISLDDPGFFNGFFHRNRNSLKKCINKEIEAIRTKAHYSGCDDLDFAKKKLVSKNEKMKRRKRILAIALMCMVFLLPFAACEKDAVSNEPETAVAEEETVVDQESKFITKYF